MWFKAEGIRQVRARPKVVYGTAGFSGNQNHLASETFHSTRDGSHQVEDKVMMFYVKPTPSEWASFVTTRQDLP
jgi:hypothetical protein